MADEAMSPGEIGRHLGRIEAQLDAGFASIRADLDKYVLLSVHQAEMRGISDRFRELEKDGVEAQTRQRWLGGLVTTTLLGVLSLAVALWNTMN